MTTDIKRDWEIRRARGSDVESLVAMRLRLDDHLVRANPRQLRLSASGRAALPDRYREALADRASCLLVAEGRTNAGIVGTAWGRASVREDITPSQVGRVDDVWVEPLWRRQGICRGLLNQLLIFFGREGVQVIDLFYTVGNAEAEHTWHGLGFQPALTVASAKVEDIIRRL